MCIKIKQSEAALSQLTNPGKGSWVFVVLCLGMSLQAWNFLIKSWRKGLQEAWVQSLVRNYDP